MNDETHQPNLQSPDTCIRLSPMHFRTAMLELMPKVWRKNTEIKYFWDRSEYEIIVQLPALPDTTSSISATVKLKLDEVKTAHHKGMDHLLLHDVFKTIAQQLFTLMLKTHLQAVNPTMFSLVFGDEEATHE